MKLSLLSYTPHCFAVTHDTYHHLGSDNLHVHRNKHKRETNIQISSIDTNARKSLYNAAGVDTERHTRCMSAVRVSVRRADAVALLGAGSATSLHSYLLKATLTQTHTQQLTLAHTQFSYVHLLAYKYTNAAYIYTDVYTIIT